MANKIKVGIVGGAGYTGGELIRILVNHPSTEIIFVHSKICSPGTNKKTEQIPARYYKIDSRKNKEINFSSRPIIHHAHYYYYYKNTNPNHGINNVF